MTTVCNDDLVITGCGVVGPAGLGVEPMWNAVADGRSLERPLTGLGFEGLAGRRTCPIPPAVESRLEFAECRVGSLMALAAEEAIRQAGWDSRILSDVSTGLCAATSKGDPGLLLKVRRNWLDGRLNGQAARFLTAWPDGPARLLVDRFGLRGPLHCPVAACATGSHALVRAAQMIRDADARRVLVVAGDASIVPLLVGAFAQMGVLTADACRPFDAARSGFAIAEGAAAVTLERRRLAAGKPLAGLSGYVVGADVTGLARQDPTAATLTRAIQLLLRRSGLPADKVGLYSAHATATPSNDAVESAAIHQAFARHADSLRVVAGKSVLGHLLGAAGLTEVVIAIRAMQQGVQPPLANLRQLDAACQVRIARRAEPADLPAAVCASLGFGGQFGLLALSRER